MPPGSPDDELALHRVWVDVAVEEVVAGLERRDLLLHDPRAAEDLAAEHVGALGVAALEDRQVVRDAVVVVEGERERLARNRGQAGGVESNVVGGELRAGGAGRAPLSWRQRRGVRRGR